MSAPCPQVGAWGGSRRRTFLNVGAIFVVLAALVIGGALVAQRVQFYASERLAYRDEFLTPDLDRYPMERKGTSPESIRWAPDGIVFDPPAGVSAYVELDTSNLIREPSRLAAFMWRLVGNLRLPPVGLLEIEVVVERRGGYVTIVDWGNVIVQDTNQGVMMTAIDSQERYNNHYFESSISSTPLTIKIHHRTDNSCVTVKYMTLCDTPAHDNRKYILLGESRIDHEHNGAQILRRIHYK